MAAMKYISSFALAAVIALAGVWYQQQRASGSVACNGHINKVFQTADSSLTLEGVVTLVFHNPEKGDARFSGWLAAGERHYRVDRIVTFTLAAENDAGLYLAKSTRLETSPDDDAPPELIRKASLLSRTHSFISMHKLENGTLVLGDGLVPFLYCTPEHAA